jgi:hypothetical protein
MIPRTELNNHLLGDERNHRLDQPPSEPRNNATLDGGPVASGTGGV